MLFPLSHVGLRLDGVYTTFIYADARCSPAEWFFDYGDPIARGGSAFLLERVLNLLTDVAIVLRQ